MVIEINEEMGVHKEWMKEAKDVKTTEQLISFVNKLINDYKHDYGTIVHACAAAMKAAFEVVNASPQGGITGFQAGCIGWEMIREFMHIGGESPAKIIDYNQLLYPMYAYKFEKTISSEIWKWLQEEAKKQLEQTREYDVALSIQEHWHSLIAGNVPFGLEVKDE